jgi:hypothetical protein
MADEEAVALDQLVHRAWRHSLATNPDLLRRLRQLLYYNQPGNAWPPAIARDIQQIREEFLAGCCSPALGNDIALLRRHFRDQSLKEVFDRVTDLSAAHRVCLQAVAQPLVVAPTAPQPSTSAAMVAESAAEPRADQWVYPRFVNDFMLCYDNSTISRIQDVLNNLPGSMEALQPADATTLAQAVRALRAHVVEMADRLAGIRTNAETCHDVRTLVTTLRTELQQRTSHQNEASQAIRSAFTQLQKEMRSILAAFTTNTPPVRAVDNVQRLADTFATTIDAANTQHIAAAANLVTSAAGLEAQTALTAATTTNGHLTTQLANAQAEISRLSIAASRPDYTTTLLQALQAFVADFPALSTEVDAATASSTLAATSPIAPALLIITALRQYITSLLSAQAQAAMQETAAQSAFTTLQSQVAQLSTELAQLRNRPAPPPSLAVNPHSDTATFVTAILYHFRANEALTCWLRGILQALPRWAEQPEDHATYFRLTLAALAPAAAPASPDLPTLAVSPFASFRSTTVRRSELTPSVSSPAFPTVSPAPPSMPPPSTPPPPFN